MPIPRRRAIVSRLDQLSALASPGRLELVDTLSRLGQASLAELAEALGRPADGLYYHVRALERVGLVHTAGSRTVGGRRERLVAATGSEYMLRYEAAPPARARAVNGIVAGMLRLGIRDFRQAFVPGPNRTHGPVRDLWALRSTGWLTDAQLRAVNREIEELKTSVSRPVPAGRLYAITIVLTPLDHRARRRPAKRKARP